MILRDVGYGIIGWWIFESVAVLSGGIATLSFVDPRGDDTDYLQRSFALNRRAVNSIN
jgi:hypothetical protein